MNRHALDREYVPDRIAGCGDDIVVHFSDRLRPSDFEDKLSHQSASTFSMRISRCPRRIMASHARAKSTSPDEMVAKRFTASGPRGPCGRVSSAYTKPSSADSVRP